jgi:hypothetical protein
MLLKLVHDSDQRWINLQVGNDHHFNLDHKNIKKKSMGKHVVQGEGMKILKGRADLQKVGRCCF